MRGRFSTRSCSLGSLGAFISSTVPPQYWGWFSFSRNKSSSGPMVEQLLDLSLLFLCCHLSIVSEGSFLTGGSVRTSDLPSKLHLARYGVACLIASVPARWNKCPIEK